MLLLLFYLLSNFSCVFCLLLLISVSNESVSSDAWYPLDATAFSLQVYILSVFVFCILSSWITTGFLRKWLQFNSLSYSVKFFVLFSRGFKDPIVSFSGYFWNWWDSFLPLMWIQFILRAYGYFNSLCVLFLVAHFVISSWLQFPIIVYVL